MTLVVKRKKTAPNRVPSKKRMLPPVSSAAKPKSAIASALDVLDRLETVGETCTKETGIATVPMEDICSAIVKLACVITGKVLYPYQVEFLSRTVEAILLHDGDMLTALWSRQSGKTEALNALTASCMIILPGLAEQFPEDWRFNITDDMGRYRGYSKGISFGIYAPILDQSQIMFERIRNTFETEETKQVMQELGLTKSVNRGAILTLSNGSSCLAMSASKNSKIEGHTHHVVIAEEAQDIDTMKLRKSIHPMIASTMGNIIKIGTANTQKGDFFQAIKTNCRLEASTGKKFHFFYPRTEVSRHNSLYRTFIEQEKVRIGEHSDEFRMSYDCEFILERGMFITDKQLMARGVATVLGKHSYIHEQGYSARNLVAGIDLGKESDSTVVTLMEVDWEVPAIHQTVFRNFVDTEFVAYNKNIIAWKELHGDDYEHQFHEVVDFLQKFNGLKKVVLDSTRESAFAHRLSHHEAFSNVEFEEFVFSRQTKAEGYRLLHNDLLSQRITFPAGDLARATSGYRKFVTQMLDLLKTYEGDYLVVKHPDEAGCHDDYPDSFMLANWGADSPTQDMSIEIFSGRL